MSGHRCRWQFTLHAFAQYGGIVVTLRGIVRNVSIIENGMSHDRFGCRDAGFWRRAFNPGDRLMLVHGHHSMIWCSLRWADRQRTIDE